MSHGDFTYMPEPLEAVSPSERSEAPKPRKPADVARAAAALCWRIRNSEPDPTKWRPMIDAADPELRECLRELLKQAYREMQQRQRRETVGKRCESGDAAMAALKQRYGGV